VNCLALGAILLPTGMPRNSIRRKRQHLISKIPLAQMGSTKQVVAALLYLVQQATYVTGETIVIDGGRRLVE
jgi:pteridine reductase